MKMFNSFRKKYIQKSNKIYKRNKFVNNIMLQKSIFAIFGILFLLSFVNAGNVIFQDGNIYSDDNFLKAENEINLNVNSSAWWSGLTSWVNGWFVQNESNLDFNEIKLNETIDSRNNWNSYGDDIYYIRGNVGIGTDTPEAKLTVYDGDISFGATANDDRGKLTGGTHGKVNIETPNRLDVVINESPEFIFRVGSFSTKNNIILDDTSGAVKLFGQYSSPLEESGWGKLWVKNTSPTELWFSDDVGTSTLLNSWLNNGSNIYYIRGNVGIGTNNPDEKLEINQGNMKITGIEENQDPIIKLDPVGIGYLWNLGSDAINGNGQFYIGQTEGVNNGALVIANGGNVGIGISTPSEKLEVNGNEYVNGTLTIGATSSTTNLLYVDAGENAGGLTIDSDLGGCMMLRDTDNAGWTKCTALNGVLSCSIDADGIC